MAAVMKVIVDECNTEIMVFEAKKPCIVMIISNLHTRFKENLWTRLPFHRSQVAYVYIGYIISYKCTQPMYVCMYLYLDFRTL